MIAPIVVFAAFSIEAKIKKTPPLSTPQAFTSLSILALLTAPAMMLLQSYPQVVAASGCIKRIQDFFLANGFKDERLVSSGSRPPGSSEQKIRNEPREKARLFTDSTDRALYLLDLILAPSSDSRPANRPITFEATRGTVTMIMGPVGSGKSTLLKAILGEINPKSGTVEIGTPFVGYCSQAPWLQNCSIRDNIVGAIEFDQDWYRSIIRLCSLQEDLVRMPQKDLTIVGSRGITLSGGQKHRVVSRRPQAGVLRLGS
jgi:ABC-type multidrug transport system fused ATPase/permease subunit